MFQKFQFKFVAVVNNERNTTNKQTYQPLLSDSLQLSAANEHQGHRSTQYS